MFDSRNIRKIGWIVFGLMWIPFTGIFVGMIGLPEGSYDWLELPAITRTSMILTGVFAGASMLLLIGGPIVSGLRNRTVRSEGLPARAKILKIWDTGTTINQNPVVGMLLEVHPPGGATFEAETEQLISRLQIPAIQPGMELEVKYDPHTQAVALVME
jgi:hypothetical protein